MKNLKRTVVFYSYFDDLSGRQLSSSDGIVIEGEVTPARVKAAVLEKWSKSGYNAAIETLEIEGEEVLLP